jgi:hypothetical protein
MNPLRWIIFIPAGLLCGTIVSAAVHFSSFMFPEFVGYMLSGAFGVAAMIMAGIYVAPVKSEAAKWILVILAMTLGILSTVGPFITGENELTVVMGISMIITAIGASRSSARDIVNMD